jgi:hypothetical protein
MAQRPYGFCQRAILLFAFISSQVKRGNPAWLIDSAGRSLTSITHRMSARIDLGANLRAFFRVPLQPSRLNVRNL